MQSNCNFKSPIAVCNKVFLFVVSTLTLCALSKLGERGEKNPSVSPRKQNKSGLLLVFVFFRMWHCAFPHSRKESGSHCPIVSAGVCAGVVRCVVRVESVFVA